jgi:hypothetical protein
VDRWTFALAAVLAIVVGLGLVSWADGPVEQPSLHALELGPQNLSHRIGPQS